jgi:hypothetical protein
MAQLIHRHSTVVRGFEDAPYEALTFGAQRADGTWEGWIEFQPLTAAGAHRSTDRETTQPNLEALAYWASGLEPVFLEGAFERAVPAIAI